jgi:hypothetical protein
MEGRLCSSVAVEAVGYQAVEANRTEYLFEVQNDDEKWTIHREPTDFVELHGEIRGDAHGISLPKCCTGGSLLDWAMSEEQVMTSLEKYIDSLLEHPEASSQQALWEFLDLYGEEGQPPGADVTLPKHPELGLGLVLEEDKTSEYQVVVRRFAKLADGSVGAAESGGEIKPGDRIVAVEWSSMYQRTYDDVLDRVADASNPVTIRFASEAQLAEHVATQVQKKQEEEALALELDGAISTKNSQNGHSNAGELKRLAGFDEYEAGTLSVALEQASAIVNTQMIGVQDPYVIVKVVRTWSAKSNASSATKGEEGAGAGHEKEVVADIAREAVLQTAPVLEGGSSPVFSAEHNNKLVFRLDDPISGQPTRFMGRRCVCTVVFEVWNGSNSILSLVHNLIGTASVTLPNAAHDPNDLAALMQPAGQEYILPVDTGGTLQLVLQVGRTTTNAQQQSVAAHVAAQYAVSSVSPASIGESVAIAGGDEKCAGTRNGARQARASVATSRGLDNKLEQSMRRISDFASSTVAGLGSLLVGGGEEDMVKFDTDDVDYNEADDTKAKGVSAVGAASSVSPQVSPSWAQSGELVVQVKGAQGLENSQDPYVICYLMPIKLSGRTKPCDSGGAVPRWGPEQDSQMRFSLDMSEYEQSGGPTSLLLQIWNKNMVLSDEQVGSALIPLPVTEHALGEFVSHPLNNGGFVEYKLLHEM